MKLTDNFTLEEMTKTATKMGNNPSMWHIGNLEQLCINILQPLRDAYGKPIIVNSGFRSKMVNEKVGGTTNSQHLHGQAADITASHVSKVAGADYDFRAENKRLFDLIQSLDLPFDQLIDEKNYQWIHVSFSSRRRKQVLHLQ